MTIWLVFNWSKQSNFPKFFVIDLIFSMSFRLFCTRLMKNKKSFHYNPKWVSRQWLNTHSQPEVANQKDQLSIYNRFQSITVYLPVIDSIVYINWYPIHWKTCKLPISINWHRLVSIISISFDLWAFLSLNFCVTSATFFRSTKNAMLVGIFCLHHFA